MAQEMKKISIVYHSGFGYMQRQAEYVAKDAPEAGAQASLGLLPGNNVSADSCQGLNAVGSFAGVMSQCNADQGVDAMAECDLQTAEHLGRRAAEIALRYHR